MLRKATLRKPTAIWLVLLAVILPGCGQAAEETATPEFETAYTPVVSVTGEVVPAAWANLSAQIGGMVTEVLVEPGDEVAAGDVLIQFDATDAQLTVQQAEAAVGVAQAQLALVKVGPLSEEIAVAEAQIVAAQAVLSQTIAQRDQLMSGTRTAEIAAAQAQLALAKAEQRMAWEQHDKTMKCFGVTEADGTERKVCPALGTLEEQARLALHAADEAVAAAQARLNAVVPGASAEVRVADAGVSVAAAQQGIAQAQLELRQVEPSSEEIAAVEATISQAQAALDAAQVALEKVQLRAPLAGTVGAVNVRVGELVVPGQVLVTVGDLTTLRVETTDLDEIDIARVIVGQQATVVFDAVPERPFIGHVTRISPMVEPGAGGVNYTVVVELAEIDPVIRWGMTAFVDIEAE